MLGAAAYAQELQLNPGTMKDMGPVDEASQEGEPLRGLSGLGGLSPAGTAAPSGGNPFLNGLSTMAPENTAGIGGLAPAATATPQANGLNVLSTESPAEGETVEQETMRVVAQTDTSVRKGPGWDSEEACVLKRGEMLKFADESADDNQGNTWYCVEYGDTIGWVLKGNVILEAGEVEEMPVVAEDSISHYSGEYSVRVSGYRYTNTVPVDGTRAFDGDLKTAWNTYEKIKGEWIEFSVTDGKKYKIGGIRIGNGYWKNNDVFYNNSAPKTVEVYCDGTYVTTVTLKMERDYQTFWFDAPVTGSAIKLLIRDGYRGGVNADCCITEIELVGPAGKNLKEAAMLDWGNAVRAAANRVNSGLTIAKGDKNQAVVGLQLLLRDGFGVLEGNADGSFGSGTQAAVDALADRMRGALSSCEPMAAGTVDAAYWRNMMAYMEIIG